MTEREFIASIGILALTGLKGDAPAFFENSRLTPTGKLWYEFFHAIPDVIFKAAIRDVCLYEEFFPAVATINRYAQKYLEADEPDPAEAWEKVVKEIKRTGHGYTPPFPDEPDEEALLQAVQAVGGWRIIGMTEEREQGILRAQFRDAYSAANKRFKIKKRLESLSITAEKRTGGVISIADALAKPISKH